MKNYPVLFNFALVLAALYILASVIYFISGLPYRVLILSSASVPLIFLIMRIVEARSFIDNKIQSVIGDLQAFSAYTKALPGYRFVDIYNAVKSLTHPPGTVEIQSQHPETLTNIINGEFFMEANRRMKPPERQARPIDEKTDGFFPVDNFWLRPPTSQFSVGAIRVRFQEYTHEVNLEVAAKNQEHAEEVINQILKLASSKSIFKNKMIEVAFEQKVKDEFGDIERNEKVDPIFLAKPLVTQNDIVLDDETWKVIQRTIIDFHERRQELIKAGLPGRRGVLFYGPPGTGKTYTCRYISHRLRSATSIVATGLSLLHIRSICNIARMLQPSIVILEDVDLVYSARERNIYTTALGELMDELDGFSSEDHIVFILTTNAIDRVEAAIRERPGRISQCIYFGPPNELLRRRYLEHLLESYANNNLNMDLLIQRTEGVTQAFLKELVYRAVQIATEHQAAAEAPAVLLTNDHFNEALEEMRKSAGASGEAIIGFRIDKH